MISPNHIVVSFRPLALLLVLVGLGAQPALAGSPTVISFEQSEGFPAPGVNFEGITTNAGLATWSSANLLPAPEGLIVEDGPDGIGYGDAPAPINGEQEATAQGVAGEIAQVIMELSTPMALDSFYYLFLTLNVKECPLLTGKRGFGQVFSGG